MERANIADLLKNILISSNQSYLKCMIEKIENRKWSYYKNALESAFFIVIILKIVTFQSLILDLNQILHLPQKKHLNAFENDLYDMVRCIELRCSHNVFHKQLTTDIKQINETDFVLVSADKTTNVYKMSV